MIFMIVCLHSFCQRGVFYGVCCVRGTKTITNIRLESIGHGWRCDPGLKLIVSVPFTEHNGWQLHSFCERSEDTQSWIIHKHADVVTPMCIHEAEHRITVGHWSCIFGWQVKLTLGGPHNFWTCVCKLLTLSAWVALLLVVFTMQYCKV
jgi:hypothetical protein